MIRSFSQKPLFIKYLFSLLFLFVIFVIPSDFIFAGEKGYQSIILLCLIPYILTYGMPRYHKINGSIYILLIILGVLISFFLASILNGFNEQLEINLFINNTISLYSIFKGFIYLLCFYTVLSDHEIFKSFLKIFIFFTLTVVLLTFFKLDKPIILGMGAKEIVNEKFDAGNIASNYDRSKYSFCTFDDNTYASILGNVIILCSFFYYRNKEKYFLLIALIFFTSILFTLGRMNSIKLLLQIMAFIFFIKRSNISRLFQYLAIISGIIFVISFTYLGQILFSRWIEIFENLKFLKTNIQYGYIDDNFVGRLIMAVDALPNTLYGWLFGNGGKAYGIKLLTIAHYQHIDFVNWISEYGLITLIPMILLYVYYFKFFLAVFKNKSHILDRTVILYSATGISLLIGLIIEQLSSPLFINFWLWLGCISLFAYHINNKEVYNNNPVKI